MQKSNKIILFISIGILATIGVVIGVSYAWWRFTATQTTVNKIDSSCLDLEIISETNDIELHNAFPIRDSEASSLIPYTFTITNTCTLNATYDVNLEVMDVTERLASEYVDVSVDGNAKIRLSGDSTAAVTYNKEYTAIEAYKLTSGVLKAGDSVSYEIRLWIDEAVTTADDVMNKNFVSKITVTGEISEAEIDELNYTVYINDTEVSTFPNKHDFAYKSVEVECSTGDASWDYENWKPIINYYEQLTSCTVRFETIPLIDYVKTLANSDNINLAYDGTIDNNLRYIGANPNNYVSFNDELWRIVGVMNNVEDAKGTKASRIKLIRASNIGSFSYNGKGAGIGSSYAEWGSND